MAFGVAQYSSDDTNQYNVRMSTAHYTAAGIANGDPANPLYPKHWTPRKVHGKDSTGAHHASLIVNEASDLWSGADNSFTIGAITYAVTGRTGEKRPDLAQPFA